MLDNKYIEIISELFKQPEIDGTKELLNYTFSIDPKDNIISYRNISLKYILAEMIWYFSGNNDVEFISQFASIWNKISDDGITNNSAYGYILKHKFSFDQIEKVIEILTLHKESRRAVININTPNRKVIETKDEPCTIALQFYIRDNKLNATGIMRSNDVWFGLPYDVIFFTELQKYIAKRLNVDVGLYTHFAVSLHMYIRDKEKLNEVLKNYELNVSKKYKINFEKIIEQATQLYYVVNKDNIIDVCVERGII
jgi:thymidylate synthase